MNEQLINALIRQKAERDNLLALKTVPRSHETFIKNELKNSLVKIISGPRRAGKSTSAVQALKEKSFAYVNFEDEELLRTISANDELIDALNIVYEEPKYFLFDEIQNLENWETFLNRQHRRLKNLIVTGSNSRLLSSELSSALTGRHVAIQVYPFSYKEYLSAVKVADQDSLETFKSWFYQGGFPDVVLAPQNATNYLKSLFDAIVFRDIVKRYSLRNGVAIGALTQLLINSIASRFTSRSLERALDGVVFSTIAKYISYLTEAYLFFELQAFSFKARQRIKSERKIYTVDNGFISSLAQNILGGEAQLLENLVFVELLRRGYVPNHNLFYAQTKDGYEVDFLISDYPKGSKLIQVSYNISSALTLEREMRALQSAAKEYNAYEIEIITFADQATHTNPWGTVKVIPAWRWCNN